MYIHIFLPISPPFHSLATCYFIHSRPPPPPSSLLSLFLSMKTSSQLSLPHHQQQVCLGVVIYFSYLSLSTTSSLSIHTSHNYFKKAIFQCNLNQNITLISSPNFYALYHTKNDNILFQGNNMIIVKRQRDDLFARKT